MATTATRQGLQTISIDMAPGRLTLVKVPVIPTRSFFKPPRLYPLSVCNDGLPDDFDPIACNGLGMRIVQSLVRKSGGDFGIGPGIDNRGSGFVVLYS